MLLPVGRCPAPLGMGCAYILREDRGGDSSDQNQPHPRAACLSEQDFQREEEPGDGRVEGGGNRRSRPTCHQRADAFL